MFKGQFFSELLFGLAPNSTLRFVVFVVAVVAADFVLDLFSSSSSSSCVPDLALLSLVARGAIPIMALSDRMEAAPTQSMTERPLPPLPPLPLTLLPLLPLSPNHRRLVGLRSELRYEKEERF